MKHTDLIKSAAATANSRAKGKSQIKCTEKRPCKRMICSWCVRQRRDYFVEACTFWAKDQGIDTFVTVTWPIPTGSCNWSVICRELPRLSKSLSWGIGPFTRVIAIGEEKGAPHVHYLVRAEKVPFIQKQAKRLSLVPGWPKIHPKPIEFTSGILGYLFDQNFTVTYFDPDRPKGIRLLSGSRGYVSFGFPKKKHIDALKKRRTADEPQHS